MTLTPTQKRRWRTTFAAYCRGAERNRLNWDYSQARRYTGLKQPASGKHVGDCSSFGATGYSWANTVTGLRVPDPLGCSYDGSGYTGTALDYLEDHPAPEGKYLIGDVALFGTRSRTVHVIWCRARGDHTTAIWTSHGHESLIFGRDAPEPVTLTIAARHQNLVGVYRNPGLL